MHNFFPFRVQRLSILCNQRRSRTHQAQCTKEQYLHEDGWLSPECKLHEQQWAVKAMSKFHEKQKKWIHWKCTVCNELWPSRSVNTHLDPNSYECVRCKQDKKQPKLYSKENDMDPGNVPQCLQGLSQIEEMLIARACPIMCIYRKHGGQRGYRGHVVNLPQNIQGFLDKLPANVNELPVLVVRRHGEDETHADFRVRRQRILEALQWLQHNNPCYRDITIDFANVDRLPEDGIPPELLVFEEVSNSEDTHTSTQGTEEGHYDSRSFLPNPVRQCTEECAVRSLVSDCEPIEWPTVGDHPINEFKTPYLATMAFPTLFPYGAGDPTNPARQRSVSLTDGLKHLLKYGETDEHTQMQEWRFASHPRFPYWGLNMKQRHQLLSQTSVYFQQNSRDANLTLDDLRSMIDNITAEQLMKRLQRYAAKVQGSSQYWFQRYQELRALIEQNGPPTLFWTVSSADNHWPALHKLLPHASEPPTHSMCIQAVINCPHITDWFFTTKLSDFVQHWLYDTLDAEWHWYRLEYQARGSTHAHGCVKLKNDPGICTLVTKAATAWLTQQDNPDDASTSDLIQEGEEAKTAVLQYADWLVTTCNMALPDEFWRLPNPHPCAVSVDEVSDLERDYCDLVNTIQRHTQCSAAYCLRKKSPQQEPKCRFDYPRPLLPESTLTFEKLSDNTIRATLTTKRNDPRVNTHNRLMLQNWRANVDVQVIVDVNACTYPHIHHTKNM